MQNANADPITEFASNVLKRREDDLAQWGTSLMTRYHEFAAMVQKTYPKVTWTRQSLQELYVELDRLLSALNSRNELEADEAMIIVFGMYTDFLRNIRRVVNSNAAPPDPVILAMVKDVLPAHPNPIWKFLGYKSSNYKDVMKIANGVQYFISLIMQEAIRLALGDQRKGVKKYDVVLALENIRRASIQSFIAARKVEENATVVEPSLSANVTASLIKNKQMLLDQADVWRTQVEHALAEAKISRDQRKYAEDALAQCERRLRKYKSTAEKPASN
jgi:hypothetical protein